MLRSKRLISDGFCVSPKFVKERVCAGQCHPIKQDNLPWWGEFLKYWDSQYIKQWRCREGLTKRRKVKLLCENGEIRTYKIKVVKSCNCVQYSNKNNEFKSKIRRQRRKRRRQRAKRRRAHGKNSKNNRQYLNSNSPELWTVRPDPRRNYLLFIESTCQSIVL